MKAVLTKADGSRVELAIPAPRLVPLESIQLFAEVNRDLRQEHVAKIVKTFNPALVQVLTVNHRGKVLRLVDGQHRYQALRQLGVSSVLCVVFENLNDEQEADLFVALNRGRLAVNAWDLWKQEVRAGHQDVVMIQRVVEAAGFKIDRKNGSNHIQAVGALRRCYQLGGAHLLEKTMSAINRMWRIDPMALDGRVIGGVSIFLWSFDNEVIYQPDRFAHITSAQPASSLIGKARKLVREHRAEDDAAGGLNAGWVSRAIVDFYNSGLPKTKRLGAPLDSRRVVLSTEPQGRGIKRLHQEEG